MKNRKITLTILFGAIICCVIGFSLLPSNRYLYRAISIGFPKIDQYTEFANRVVKAGDPQPWPKSTKYQKVGISPNYEPYFNDYETVAYLVIQNDSILFEKYWDGYSDSTLSNSFSMAKSVVSLLVGIAIEEGYIKGISQPISDFLPNFGEYNGVALTIQDLLTMSAGIKWNESSQIFSSTSKAYYTSNLIAQVKTIKQDSEPGKKFEYQSGVTEILGQILALATGRNISDYASEKLWTPMQAEHNALWSLDRKNGDEKAFCCFNSNAHDFARFGQLILNNGVWNGQQLIPIKYLKNATQPATWLMVGDSEDTNYKYGYQFWILERNRMVIPYMNGMLGQYVFAIPSLNAVIVRLGRSRSDVYTTQGHHEDINTWLDAGFDIINQAKR